MLQGTSALAVYWSHSDICRGLSSFQLSGSLYKSSLVGGPPLGKSRTNKLQKLFKGSALAASGHIPISLICLICKEMKN